MTTRQPISVVGAGAMGAALAVHLQRIGRDVVLLATRHDDGVIDAHATGRPHPGLGLALPASLRVVGEEAWHDALARSDLAIVAVAGAGLPSVSKAVVAAGRTDALIGVATKGWERDGLRHAAALVADNTGARDRTVAIAGPSLAREVALGVPTALVCAGWSLPRAGEVASVLRSETMRADVTTDVDGVAAGSVVKNLAAVGVGLCASLPHDSSLNARAALFSVSLREMAELAIAVGGQLETVLGQAGAGDLYVTCLGGRNARFGELLGSGLSTQEALDRIASTVEGYANAETFVALADHHRLRVPFLRSVAAVLLEGRPPATALDVLFSAA